MDNGLVTIIAASIGGFVSLTIFSASTLISKMNTDKSIKADIYRMQLTKIFSPLELLLKNSPPEVNKALLTKTNEIIHKNLDLVPPVLIEEYSKLLRVDDKEMMEIFSFRDVVSSYFNWLKKNLGYPYDGTLINVWCLQPEETLSIIVQSFKKPALITTIMFILVIAVSLLQFIIGDEWMSVVKTLGLYFGFFFLGAWMASSPPKFRRQGSYYKKSHKKASKIATKYNGRKCYPKGVVVKPILIRKRGNNTNRARNGRESKIFITNAY